MKRRALTTSQLLKPSSLLTLQTESGRIAVKVINHLGDEVMKVFQVN